MISREKRALWSFLGIYTLSAFALMALIGFLYFKKEMVTIQNQCQIKMKSRSMAIKMDLMDHKKISLDPADRLRVGLYDNDFNSIQSTLTTDDINFSQAKYMRNSHAFYIDRFEKATEGVRYVVIEDSQVTRDIRSLKLLILATLLVASIFVGFIGYLLSKLLLKPVKDNLTLLNRFVKDSAHELNTPVTALMMSANMLKKEYDKETVEHIAASSKMISELYNSIAYLAFHDLRDDHKTVINLADCVQTSIQFFKDIAETKSLIIASELDDFHFLMDENSARKLINNLISNAIKYSYSNTTITIALHNNRLSIKDQGVGISTEEQKMIFKRYSRVDGSSVGGFGIGLDIVARICEEYRITIEIHSSPGQGSEFVLTFPEPTP